MPAKSKTKKALRGSGSNDLSDRLQQFRISTDSTYDQLANLIGGVSAETVRKIATGIGSPNLRTLAKVESFLSRLEANRAA